jgi:hypothetical protein
VASSSDRVHLHVCTDSINWLLDVRPYVTRLPGIGTC